MPLSCIQSFNSNFVFDQNCMYEQSSEEKSEAPPMILSPDNSVATVTTVTEVNEPSDTKD